MPHSRLALEAVVRHDGKIIARCLLRRGRYVIGQERKNEIMVEAASVSGKHARLTVASDDQFFLEDLGSANGTFVNGSAIKSMTPVTLDCEIALGSTTLEFQRGGLPASVFRHLPAGFLRTARYVAGQPIVQGHTSTIFDARDTVLQCDVAMKVLLPESQVSSAQVLAFIREAQITEQLPHAAILPVHDLGLNEERRLFSITRFVEGQSLAGRLTTSAESDAQPLNFFSLIRIFQKVCDAVAFAHSRGVVHGALRPEAVIVGRFGQVFVDHWGLAKIIVPLQAGTPPIQAPESSAHPPLSRYSAPEQAEGAIEDIDQRTDVHALGAILFRLLTLQDSNCGETDAVLLDQALSPRVPPAQRLAGQAPLPHWPGGRMPEFLAAVAMKALSLARDERYATVREVQKDLAAWQDGAVEGGESSGLWKQVTGLLGRH